MPRNPESVSSHPREQYVQDALFDPADNVREEYTQEALFELDENGRPVNDSELGPSGEQPLFEMPDSQDTSEPLPNDEEARNQEHEAVDLSETDPTEEDLLSARVNERLNDPNLSGMRGVRRNTTYAMLRTIDGIDKVTAPGVDTVTYIRKTAARGQLSYAARKLKRYEEKSGSAWTAKGRKRNKIKAERQRLEVRARRATFNRLEAHHEGRGGRREAAHRARAESYLERVSRLAEDQRSARERKLERHARRKETWANRLPLSEEKKQQIRNNRSIIDLIVTNNRERVERKQHEYDLVA